MTERYMRLGEALSYTSKVSDFHDLNLQIPNVARFTFNDDGTVHLNLPIDIEGLFDCWAPQWQVEDVYFRFDPIQWVRFLGIGEDVVLVEMTNAPYNYCPICGRDAFDISAVRQGSSECLHC